MQQRILITCGVVLGIVCIMFALTGFTAFMWWFWAGVAYIIMSFRWYPEADGSPGPVQPDEIAVLTRFGKPVDLIDSGLPFAPLGLYQLIKLPVLVQQKEFPGEPREIFQGELKGEQSNLSGEVIPKGMVPPERITFRSAVSEAEARELLGNEFTVTMQNGEDISFVAKAPKDGLAKRVTTEVVPVVRWRIANAIDFVQNIGSVNEANRQIEDELFSVLQRTLPNMSVGQAKQNVRWISALLYHAVISRTEEWGIEVETAFLKAIRLNHALNGAMAEAAEAEFKGRADRELAIRRGEGTAKAAKDLAQAQLEGQAAGLVKLANDLGIEGEAAVAQFVAGQIAEGGNAIILGTDGISQLAGIATALTRNQQKPNDNGTQGGTE